jgi:hypothetical protein
MWLALPLYAQNYTIFGITEPTVYPLYNVQNQPIQWNVSTFEGFVSKGKTKKDLCEDGAALMQLMKQRPMGSVSTHCYSYDGRGDWHFELTGTLFCPSTCEFYGTGELVVGPPVTLPDGSSTRELSANLVGTYSDDQGNTYSNVMAVYYSKTAPTIGWPKDDIPVPTFGDFTVVLADN